MVKNLGELDRSLRLLVGMALLGAGVYFNSWWGLLGLVPIATAALAWCPAYLPFRWSTRRGPS